MKELDIYGYYVFGYNYYLVKQGFSNETNKVAADFIREHYLDYLVDLDLQVTLQVVKEIHDVLEELDGLPSDELLSEENAGKIKELVDKTDATLDAELQLRKVLYVTPKRFTPDILMKNPERLLASGMWGYLSDTAMQDFKLATSCIAMNHGTASAFHMMRCVEEMVKQLYFSFVKTNRIRKPMWGPIIQKLEQKNNPKPSQELLDSLDMIRRNYRNPTQHPDKFYSIDEAQDLLHHSIVAINMITSVLKERA
ncbi:hypothetical protein BTR13_23745 [Vibrio parahaemolyticus]|nr:hypothetical protein [Vibrio parahaemolyticus]OUJ27090.1 hypothetical protein BTR13_23745 [Vibrio parahaemolyticus]